MPCKAKRAHGMEGPGKRGIDRSAGDISVNGMEEIRLDRYLWHVRLAKTRTLATQACQSGDVRIDGGKVKPSRLVRAGVEFELRRHGMTRSYRIVSLVSRRGSAKAVPEHLEETTPPEVIEAARQAREDSVPRRPKGMGRPTKEELHMIEKLYS